jgi:hypothetical protein
MPRLTVSRKVTSSSTTFGQEVISGCKSHKGARYQDLLTDSHKVTSTLTFRQEVVSGRKSHKGARHQDRQTDVK